jgi:hypothetical protein
MWTDTAISVDDTFLSFSVHMKVGFIPRLSTIHPHGEARHA